MGINPPPHSQILYQAVNYQIDPHGNGPHGPGSALEPPTEHQQVCGASQPPGLGHSGRVTTGHLACYGAIMCKCQRAAIYLGTSHLLQHSVASHFICIK